MAKKSSDKNTKKKAVSQTKDYYNKNAGYIQQGTDIKIDAAKDTNASTVRNANQSKGDISDDLRTILGRLGIKGDQINEDFMKVAGRLSEDKATGIEAIDNYVKTNTKRTSEDLNTALENEGRRYAIQQDRNNLDATAKNQVFSSIQGGGVRAETENRAADTNKQITGAATTAATRSFEDIKRDEFVKTNAVMQTYTRGTEDATTAKDRGLADILNQTTDAQNTASRGIRTADNQITDANTAMDNTLNATALDNEKALGSNTYGMNDDISTINNTFADKKQNTKNNAEDKAILG
jgi:hypothetical protein